MQFDTTLEDLLEIRFSYWGLKTREFDRPTNRPGSILSKVNNCVKGEPYVILTAQEVSENYLPLDYWTSIIMPAEERKGFLVMHLKVYRSIMLEYTRNSMNEAHAVHAALKQVIKNNHWKRFYELSPDLVPSQGYSPDALRKLAEKGFSGDSQEMEALVRAHWKFKSRCL
jgi:hypothetical protein